MGKARYETDAAALRSGILFNRVWYRSENKARKRVYGMNDDFDMDDLLGDSNAGAYRRKEIREGPPLSYVAEKLGSALEELHYGLRLMNEAGALRSRDDDGARVTQGAFRYTLTAFCALHNMLSLAGDPGLADRLLDLPPQEFRQWVTDVTSEGSVT